MKVVILAAGFGARFGDHDLPKPLTLLDNGVSILQLQIQRLSKIISLHNIIIVVGYHKEQIMDRFPDLLYVYSANYAQENTAKSLLRAVEKIDDDLLWLNGDVVFHPKVLEAIKGVKRSSMIVNDGAVGDEEVKYRTNSDGQILEVSKQVENPQGEALGINFFAKQDLPLLRRKLAECAPKDYFERAIEMGVNEGLQVWSIPIQHDHCIEIDFVADLQNANSLLKSWKT